MAEIDERSRIGIFRGSSQWQRRFVVARRTFSNQRPLLLQECAARLPFLWIWTAAEGEAISRFDLLIGIGARRLNDASGKVLRPFQSHFAVEQVQRLDRAGGDVSPRATFVRVWHVQAFEKRIACIATNKDINAATIALRSFRIHFPTAAR